MDVSAFFRSYPDEQSCKLFFREKMAAKHSTCGRCGSVQLRWEELSSRWRCKECKHTMSLKKGTVMENSNLGYKTWLWGLYFMSLTKKGFSASEMQRLLGHKRYEPIWLMMHKIRISMGHRDDGYTLDGYIEMDEGFFEGHRKLSENGEPMKELDRQVKAIVAVSTLPKLAADSPLHHSKPTTKCGFVKMSVVKSLNKDEVNYEAASMVSKSATVVTDGRRCYGGLQEICKTHRSKVVKDKKEVSKVFPWVHTAISNAKKKLQGLHHHVKDVYMQNYLNEFCYKFNRRYFGQALFHRLLIASLSSSWYKPNYG